MQTILPRARELRRFDAVVSLVIISNSWIALPVSVRITATPAFEYTFPCVSVGFRYGFAFFVFRMVCSYLLCFRNT